MYVKLLFMLCRGKSADVNSLLQGWVADWLLYGDMQDQGPVVRVVKTCQKAPRKWLTLRNAAKCSGIDDEEIDLVKGVQSFSSRFSPRGHRVEMLCVVRHQGLQRAAGRWQQCVCEEQMLTVTVKGLVKASNTGVQVNAYQQQWGRVRRRRQCDKCCVVVGSVPTLVVDEVNDFSDIAPCGGRSDHGRGVVFRCWMYNWVVVFAGSV
eukprot:2315900-Amphidinium_carterae.1